MIPAQIVAKGVPKLAALTRRSERALSCVTPTPDSRADSYVSNEKWSALAFAIRQLAVAHIESTAPWRAFVGIVANVQHHQRLNGRRTSAQGLYGVGAE